MATSDSLADGPPTKKAKIGGDANGEKISDFSLFTFLNLHPTKICRVPLRKTPRICGNDAKLQRRFACHVEAW